MLKKGKYDYKIQNAVFNCRRADPDATIISPDLIVGLEREDIISKHHNAHVVTTNGSGNVQMKAFEVIDYNDDELRMLEALVGRKPTFDK